MVSAAESLRVVSVARWCAVGTTPGGLTVSKCVALQSLLSDSVLASYFRQGLGKCWL